VLIVSGSSKGAGKEEKKEAPSWYDRIAAVTSAQPNPLRAVVHRPQAGDGRGEPVKENKVEVPAILPAGKRAARNTAQQQRGIWLHALLQHITDDCGADEHELRQRFSIPPAEMASLWQQARDILASPHLARFFDARQYHSACNEMPYINANGELKRIDRLVEFDDEVWVLDYKLGDREDAARYRPQLEEYRTAMETVSAGKAVRCALVYADGALLEL